MVGGAPPFSGPTAQAILASVLTVEPAPLRLSRPTVPPHLAAAIETALEKIPADRFQTAGEFAEALTRPTTRTARRLAAGGGRGTRRATLAAAAATLVVAGGLLGWSLADRPAPRPAETRYWSLMLPSTTPLALTGPGPLGVWQLGVALAPTGDRLAYAAASGATTVLAIRPLDRDSAAVLPGTEGAYHPFYSPDGRWIAYFAGNELRKVLAAGGSPVTLATVDRPIGATWPTDDEIILFQQDGFQMRRVAASGGRDSTVLLQTQFDAPHILPDGEWAVGHLGSGQLALLSLKDASLLAVTRRGVIPLDSVQLPDLLVGASPKYVSSGHIVFAAGDGQLMALPFDAKTRKVVGEPVPVVDGVRVEEGFGFAQYVIGPDGTLVFVPGRNQLHGSIAFLQPGGGLDTIPLPRAQYTQPRLSPDGRRLAVQVRLPVGGWDVLVVDLATGVPERIPVEGNYRAYPASWTPDSRSLLIGLFHPVRNVFLGTRMYHLTQRSWEALPPLIGGSYLSIAPNGREFVFSNWRTGDLAVRPLRGDTTATRIPARGFAASFSPDGRWLAWGGADGGVAVSPIPPTGAIHPVVERGQQPLWTPDGRRLIYRDGRRYFEVDVSTAGAFQAGRPRLLAEGPFIRTFAWNHSIGSDGRLAVLVATPGDATRELGVITGFDQLLLQRAPRRTTP